MIDSILPALGLRVHLIASPHFDELRRPANLALQVTFNVIYPAAPVSSRVDSFAPAHSDIRSAHCAAPGAGAELVVLVFEQDVERGEQCVTARESVKLRGSHAPFVARVYLLLENSQIIPDHDDLVEECFEPATAGKLIVCRLHNQHLALKHGFNGRNSHFYSSSFRRF